MTTKDLTWPLSLGTLMLFVLLATAGCDLAANKTMYDKAYDRGYDIGVKTQAQSSQSPELADRTVAEIASDLGVEQGTPEYEEVLRGAKDGYRKGYRK